MVYLFDYKTWLRTRSFTHDSSVNVIAFSKLSKVENLMVMDVPFNVDLISSGHE
ncbi:MAG: hypothetical protein JNL11_09330 [Bdellovibrionaceae bacterium]|nr:hypothetical protein [Pseudobdellovibrionaceae bacterium]